jgi:hypothetical protein
MEIVFSHIKEPIRKGKPPAEVFNEFRIRIEAEDVSPEIKAANLKNLRHAVGLAWDEVRPIAIMNRNLNRKEAAQDSATTPRTEPPSCSHGS